MNDDGVVNVTDLLTVISFWGQSDQIADVNSDGLIDVSDILMLIGLGAIVPPDSISCTTHNIIRFTKLVYFI